MHQQFRVIAKSGDQQTETHVQESGLFQEFSRLMQLGECDEIIATSHQFHYFLAHDYLDHWEIACSYKSIGDASNNMPDLLEVGSNNPDGSPKYS